MKRGRPDRQLRVTFPQHILVRVSAEDMLWLTYMYSALSTRLKHACCFVDPAPNNAVLCEPELSTPRTCANTDLEKCKSFSLWQ